MSYASLLLEGSDKTGVGNSVITNIELYFEGTIPALTPKYLQKQSYTISRELKPKNVSNQVPNRHQSLVVDIYREHHTWIGFCDVRSDSICYYSGAPDYQDKTVELLKEAIIYQPGTGGIEYQVAATTGGVTDPSLNMTNLTCIEIAPSFVYKQEGPVLFEIPYWLIKDINIQGNQNGTSRVTFTFTCTTPWQSLATKINAFNA